MNKKVACLFLTLVFIFSQFHSLEASMIADDISSHPQEKEMRYLNSEQIMLGYGPGVFRPSQHVTRAEFAAFMARALQLPVGEPIVFEDVPEGYKGNLDIEINRASAAGLIIGSDGKFRPDDQISRQEMAVIISRALVLKEISTEPAPLTFTDRHNIADWALEAVQLNVALKIINGHTDGSFKPTNQTIRAHAAKVIFEMLNVIEPIIIEDELFRVVALDAQAKETEVKKFKTYDEAIQFINNQKNNSYHLKYYDKFIWVPANPQATATATARPYVLIYETANFGKWTTYLQTGSQLDVLSVTGEAVHVRISGVTGYVKIQDVSLNPGILNPLRSFYRVGTDGLLYHTTVLNGKQQWPYAFMQAAPSMKPNEIFYNWDVKTFGEVEIYPYYQYLPLYTKTVYTSEQLNEYVANVRPTSPLQTLGDKFKLVEAEFGINALHLLALAIHEGGWGESAIARDKKNLYGMGAVDSDAYKNAVAYETFEDSIRDFAQKISTNYLNHLGRFYNGPFLGNKSVGMNVRYASDPFWGQKAAAHMFRIDRYFEGVDSNDQNRYRVGIIQIQDGLRVRSTPWGTEQFKYPANKKDISMVIVDEVKASDGSTWFKIISDHPDHEFGFVYAFGDLGVYVKELK